MMVLKAKLLYRTPDRPTPDPKEVGTMLVRPYMHSPVICIDQQASIEAGLRLMHQHKIQRLPVIDKAEALVGMVTERDLLYALPVPVTALGQWGGASDGGGTTIKSLMAKNVVRVHENTPVDMVVSLMFRHKIAGIPVIDDQNHVIGIVTKSDLLKAYLDRHHHRPDMDIFLLPERSIYNPG
jgi:acetoin utilization protein AcuB